MLPLDDDFKLDEDEKDDEIDYDLPPAALATLRSKFTLV
jgi:hypothetical protein